MSNSAEDVAREMQHFEHKNNVANTEINLKTALSRLYDKCNALKLGKADVASEIYRLFLLVNGSDKVVYEKSTTKKRR